jgi:PAS domain S-box-containing protein
MPSAPTSSIPPPATNVNNERAHWLLHALADSPCPLDPAPTNTQGPEALSYALSRLALMLRVSQAEAYERLLAALAAPENERGLNQARAEQTQGEFRDILLLLRDAAGKQTSVRVSFRPLLDANRKVTAVTGALSLAESDPGPTERLQLFEQLIENSSEAIAISDGDSQVVYVNPAYARLFGRSAADILNDGFRDFYPAHSLTRVDTEIVPALGSGRSWEGELDAFDAQGRPFTHWTRIDALRDEQGRLLFAFVILHEATERKQAQLALEQSERRLTFAFEAGDLGIWEWSIDSDALRVGQGHAAMLGYALDELPRTLTASYEFMFPEDLASLKAALQAHISGGTRSLQHLHRLISKNGEPIWILSRGKKICDERGRVVGLVGVDLNITELKRAEQAIEAERARLFSLLDRLPALIFLLGQDYSLRFVNRHFSEEFGSFRGRSCYECLGRETPCEPCPALEVLDTRGLAVWEQEIPGIGKTYQFFSYPFSELDGAPLALVVGFDITRNKLAQEALRASEERYRSITDNLALGIAVIGADFQVQAVNPKMRAWYPELDASKRPLCFSAIIDHEQAGPCPECPLQRAIQRGEVQEVSLHTSKAHGERVLRITYCPMVDGRGKVSAAVALVEDATERLQVQAQLARAQRLEALGAMAGGIAHEINQPLNALQLYVSGLEMLIEKKPELDRETVLTRLDWILGEAGKIRDIITHMRALVRQGRAAEIGPSDLCAAVRSAVALLDAQARAHNVSIELDLPDEALQVKANAVQLEQVLVNLVVNAIQSLDGYDAQQQPDKKIQLRCQAEDETVSLVVEDNGPGLKGLEERVFDPFFTSKDGKGMGLGLSIVHAFVRSWGGEIRAQTSESGGAVFWVHLARQQET